MQRHTERSALVRYGAAAMCVTAAVIGALWLRRITLASAELLSVAALVVAGLMARVSTTRRKAEDQRQEHVWLLERLDRVNGAIQTTDLAQMASNVLEVALSIFECDRAALIGHWDAETETGWLYLERTRAGFDDVVPGGERRTRSQVQTVVYPKGDK